MKNIIVHILAMVVMHATSAQDLKQSIRGQVIDKDTRQPIPGANVVLLDNPDSLVGTSTDLEGRFELKNVTVGRHTVQFTFMGYLPQILNNIEVNTGRQTIINIQMEGSAIEMEAIEISATRDGEPLNEMAVISARQFNVEETERYAGSRGEPSRMASNFAGVQGADDSRNDIVIRGNSPQAILWRVEDIPISNPNHFNIPGTAGGSVSILNNKTLGNSDFYTGAFPAEFGNATAGVFDLNLRNGNNQRHEFVGQFGFLGTEAMIEGPLSRDKNITYMAAYRYSTLAMIGGLGIEYGTDAIPKYQDMSFKINIPGKGASSFSVFGVGGLSDIDILISDQETPEDRNIYGDNDRDQYFGSKMGVLGASYTRSLNEKTYVKTVIAYNYSEVNSYHELIYRHLDLNNRYVVDSANPLLRYQFREQRTALHTFLNTKLSRNHVVKAGVVAEHLNLGYADSTWVFDTAAATYNTWRVRWDSRDQSMLLQPYVQWKYRPNNNWLVTVGLHSQYFTLSNAISWVEPRAAIRKTFKDGSSFNLGGGLHSQTQPYYLYYFSEQRNAQGSPELYNKGMDFTKAIHSVAGYDRMLKPNLRFKSEVYFQWLYDIPIDPSTQSFSLANTGSGFERFFPDTLVNAGNQRNYGVEFTLEKFFAKNYYFMLTASLFESKYRAADKQWRNTDFNGNFATNALFAKEFNLSQRSMLSLGGKATVVGGRWYGPPNIAESNRQRELVVIDSLRNTQQFPHYFRVDVKLNYRYNAKRITHELGIDLVNVLNTRNVLSLTYAPDENANPNESIRREYQLGRLPLFYYRISF